MTIEPACCSASTHRRVGSRTVEHDEAVMARGEFDHGTNRGAHRRLPSSRDRSSPAGRGRPWCGPRCCEGSSDRAGACFRARPRSKTAARRRRTSPNRRSRRAGRSAASASIFDRHGRDVDGDRRRADAAFGADEREHLADRPYPFDGRARARSPPRDRRALTGSVSHSLTPARIASSISAGSSLRDRMMTPVDGCWRLTRARPAGRTCVVPLIEDQHVGLHRRRRGQALELGHVHMLRAQSRPPAGARPAGGPSTRSRSRFTFADTMSSLSHQNDGSQKVRA